MKQTIDEKKVADVRAMRAGGMTWPDIAQHYGCSATTVRYWAMTEQERKRCNCKVGRKSRSIVLRPTAEPSPPPIPKWTPVRDPIPGTPPIERSALYERATEEERERLLLEACG